MSRIAIITALITFQAGVLFGFLDLCTHGNLVQTIIWKSIVARHYDEAMSLADLAERLRPESSADSWNTAFGENLILLGRYREAKSVLERDISTEPYSWAYKRALLAEAYLGLDEYEDAANITSELFKEPIDSFDVAQCYIAHGKALMCLGRIDEAVEAFRQAKCRLGDKRLLDLYIGLARVPCGDCTGAQEITNKIFLYWCQDRLNEDPEQFPEFEYLETVMACKNCPLQAAEFAKAAAQRKVSRRHR